MIDWNPIAKALEKESNDTTLSSKTRTQSLYNDIMGSLDNGHLGVSLSTDQGILQVKGLDAERFLQGQVTCDVAQLEDNAHCYGAHCNPKGRMIALFLVFKVNATHFLLRTHVSNVENFANAIKKYAVFFKVEITQPTTILPCVVYGEQIESAFTSSLPYTIQHKENVFETLIAQSSLTELTHHQKLRRLPDNQLNSIELNKGIVQITQALSESFIPHDVNLGEANGISYTKGCYTGQEIIARMHYLGKLKTHLHQIKLDSNNESTAISIGSIVKSSATSKQIATVLQIEQTKLFTRLLISGHINEHQTDKLKIDNFDYENIQWEIVAYAIPKGDEKTSN